MPGVPLDGRANDPRTPRAGCTLGPHGLRPEQQPRPSTTAATRHSDDAHCTRPHPEDVPAAGRSQCTSKATWSGSDGDLRGSLRSMGSAGSTGRGAGPQSPEPSKPPFPGSPGRHSTTHKGGTCGGGAVTRPRAHSSRKAKRTLRPSRNHTSRHRSVRGKKPHFRFALE